MGTPDPAALGHLDRTYVAYCLATEIIRVKRSAAKAQATGGQTYDWARLLAQPLEQFAERLGLAESVTALVRDALRTTEPSALPPVHAVPIPSALGDPAALPFRPVAGELTSPDRRGPTNGTSRLH